MRLLGCNNIGLMQSTDAQNLNKDKCTPVSDNHLNPVELQPKKDVDAFKRLLHQLGSSNGNGNNEGKSKMDMAMFMTTSPTGGQNLPHTQMFNASVDHHHQLNMMAGPLGNPGVLGPPGNPGVLAQSLLSTNSIHYKNMQNHPRQSQQQFQQTVAPTPPPPSQPQPTLPPTLLPLSHHMICDEKTATHFDQLTQSLVGGSQQHSQQQGGDGTAIISENRPALIATTASPYILPPMANICNNNVQQSIQCMFYYIFIIYFFTFSAYWQV